MRFAMLLLIITTACFSPVGTTDQGLGPEEYWHIVDWPLSKSHHTSEQCPTQDLGDVTYTVEYPYAFYPLTPVILEEPLWECEPAPYPGLGEVTCAYLFDEDLELIDMALRDDSYQQYVEIWFDAPNGGICHYVFEPG